MKRLSNTLWLLFALAWLCAPAWGDERPEHGVSVPIFVTNVTDGDTIDVELRMRIRVRLIDCWAPESRTTDLTEKALGQAAKRNMVRMADKQFGTLFIPTQNAQSVADVLTLDRVLGKVWIDGNPQDLSTRQVEKELAATQKGFPLGQ